MSRATPMPPEAKLLAYWRQLGLQRTAIIRLTPRQRRRYRHSQNRALRKQAS